MDSQSFYIFWIFFYCMPCLADEDSGSSSTSSYFSHQSLVKCQGSIRYPNTTEEIISLVKMARKTGQKLKPIGTLHSISSIICTDEDEGDRGIPLSLRNINHTLYNKEDGIATFGAGIQLSQALEFLDGKKRSLEHVPYWGNITLGGAIATGAHGSSLTHPTTLSDQVVELTVINSKGKIQKIKKSRDIELFAINLGLLGIVVEVRVRTVPLYKMTRTHRIMEEKDLLSGEVVNWVKDFDLMDILWFPSLEEMVVVTGIYHQVKVGTPIMTSENKNNWIYEFLQNLDTPGNASLTLGNSFTGWLSGYLGKLGMDGVYWMRSKVMFQLVNTVFIKCFVSEPLFGIGMNAIVTEAETGSFANPSTGIGWRLQVTDCTPPFCAWEHERFEDISLVFDLDHFSVVLSRLQEFFLEYPHVPFLGGIFIRFQKASDIVLSTAYGKDSFSFEWLISSRIYDGEEDWAKQSVKGMDELLEDLMVKFQGRAHWGKGGVKYLRPENIRGLKRFEEFRKSQDPKGIFENNFSRRFFSQSKIQACYIDDAVCKMSK